MTAKISTRWERAPEPSDPVHAEGDSTDHVRTRDDPRIEPVHRVALSVERPILQHLGHAVCVNGSRSRRSEGHFLAYGQRAREGSISNEIADAKSRAHRRRGDGEEGPSEDSPRGGADDCQRDDNADTRNQSGSRPVPAPIDQRGVEPINRLGLVPRHSHTGRQSLIGVRRGRVEHGRKRVGL